MTLNIVTPLISTNDFIVVITVFLGITGCFLISHIFFLKQLRGYWSLPLAMMVALGVAMIITSVVILLTIFGMVSITVGAQ